MPHWLIKSALHRAASMLPQRQILNSVFQKWSRSLELSADTFLRRVEEAQRVFDFFKRHAPGSPAAFTVLEIGTGWYPIIPLCLYLRGAQSVWTHDIEPMVNRPRLLRTAQLFVENADAGRLDAMLPGWQRERLDRLREIAADQSARSPAELLAPLGFHLRVLDAQHTGLESGSIDLITSSSVLMYIPKPILEGIYREFRRTAKSDATMVHRLNFRDIYSYFDPAITSLNMLRFSPTAWRWLDSPVVPQNRLRLSDHHALQQAAGFRIVDEQHDSAPAETLRRVRLAEEFRHYREDDLLVLESWIVSQPI